MNAAFAVLALYLVLAGLSYSSSGDNWGAWGCWAAAVIIGLIARAIRPHPQHLVPAPRPPRPRERRMTVGNILDVLREDSGTNPDA